MKHLTQLHLMALALAFTILAGTSVFAADPSNALNEDSHLLSSNDFSALSGISADPMNEAELEQIQGKGCGDSLSEPPCVMVMQKPWDNPDPCICPQEVTKDMTIFKVIIDVGKIPPQYPRTQPRFKR